MAANSNDFHAARWFDVYIGLLLAGGLSGYYAYYDHVQPKLFWLWSEMGIGLSKPVRFTAEMHFFGASFYWIFTLIAIAYIVAARIAVGQGWISPVVPRAGAALVALVILAFLFVGMFSAEKLTADEMPKTADAMWSEVGELSAIHLAYDIRRVKTELGTAAAASCSMDELKPFAEQIPFDRARQLRFYYTSPIGDLAHDIQFVDCDPNHPRNYRIAIFPRSGRAAEESVCVGPSGMLHHAAVDEGKSEARKKFIERCD